MQIGFVFFFKQKTADEVLRSLVGSEMCIRDRTGSWFRFNDNADYNNRYGFTNVAWRTYDRKGYW